MPFSSRTQTQRARTHTHTHTQKTHTLVSHKKADNLPKELSCKDSLEILFLSFIRKLSYFCRYAEAKEQSVVDYVFELYRLSSDYESKARTNPLTFFCHLVLWRAQTNKKPDSVCSAERAKTFIEMLFELRQFVCSRHQPTTVRRNAMFLDMADDEAGLSQLLEEADCEGDFHGLSMRQARLKWKLKRAVEAEAELAFEEQRVQVSSHKDININCSLNPTTQPELEQFVFNLPHIQQHRHIATPPPIHTLTLCSSSHLVIPQSITLLQ
jgi:hypothetical protein